jgi:hypothetical protein
VRRPGLSGCAVLSCLLIATPALAQSIAVAGDRLTIDGHPRFLLFLSYFDAMRARWAPCGPGVRSLECDFEYIKRTLKFDGVRILANWTDWRDLHDPADPREPWFARDTLLAPDGTIRRPRMEHLKGVLRRARAAGLVVDLTFTRETVCRRIIESGRCAASDSMSVPAYVRAVRAAIAELAADPSNDHVLVDLQNERNLADRPLQFLPVADVKQLSDQLRGTAGTRRPPIAASMEQSASPAEVARFAHDGALDIAAWHEPRNAEWFRATDRQVKALRDALRSVCGDTSPRPPIYLQEPQRWQNDPNAVHFGEAARRARSAGAAAWTFHTRTGFNVAGTSLLARLEKDPAQKRALEQLHALTNDE